MTKAQCILCVQDQPIDAFRSLPCGHTYCTTCIETWVRRRPLQQQALCPTCRGPFIEADLRRTFLTLPGSYGASQNPDVPPEPEDVTVGLKHQTNYVVDRLKQICTNTPAKSAVRAGREIGKIAKYTDELVGETQSTLWAAVDELKDRIAPMYVEKADREKTIATLQSTMDYLNAEVEEYEKLSETLRVRAGQHQKRCTELETENRELKGRLAGISDVSTLSTEKLTALEDENRSLRMELEEQKQKANKAKIKTSQRAHAADALAPRRDARPSVQRALPLQLDAPRCAGGAAGRGADAARVQALRLGQTAVSARCEWADEGYFAARAEEEGGEVNDVVGGCVFLVS